MFLDFDGVLCDSVSECFVSSWIAYYTHYLGSEPLKVDLAYRQIFDSLRPFIRHGEDYLVIHDALANKRPISGQKDFDQRIAEAGVQAMQEFRALMYRVREDLVGRERDFWISLHRMYPHILPSFQMCAGNPDVFILSTKKKEYVEQMLDGIAIDSDRVISSGARSKSDVMSDLLDSTGVDKAVFIDDHIDHIRRVTDGRITSYLADWGYVRPEWLSAKDVVSIRSDQLVEMLRSYSSLS